MLIKTHLLMAGILKWYLGKQCIVTVYLEFLIMRGTVMLVEFVYILDLRFACYGLPRSVVTESYQFFRTFFAP